MALPLKGLWLVSRLESSQANECVLGVIQLEGIGVFEGKSVLSLGLCSAPWKMNHRLAKHEFLQNTQASSPGSQLIHWYNQ